MTWYSARLASAKEETRLQEIAFKAEESRAAVQEFYARYGRGSASRGQSRPNGWLKTNLEEIQLETGWPLATTDETRQLLRTEALRCFCSHDVRAVKTLLTDVDVSCLAHHPTQPILAVGDNCSKGMSVTIRLVDTKTHRMLRSLTFSISTLYTLTNRTVDGCRSMAFTSSGDKLFVGSRSGWVYVWDSKSWKLIDSWQAHSDWVSGMAIDPDGQTIYTGSMRGDIKQWRIAGHAPGEQAQVKGELYGLCLTKKHLVVSADQGVLLGRPDLKPQAFSDTWADGARSATPGADRSGIFIGHGTGLTQLELEPLYEYRKLEDPRLRQAHKYGVNSLHSDPSGRFVVSTDSSFAKVWDATGGTLIATINCGADGAKTAEFSPDESQFAVAGDNQVELYEIDQFPGWTVQPRDSGPILDACLSKNGQISAQYMERGISFETVFGLVHVKNLTSGAVHEYTVGGHIDNEIAAPSDGDLVVTTEYAHSYLVEASSTTHLPRRAIPCGPNPRLLTMDGGMASFYLFRHDDVAAIVSKPPSALFVCELRDGEPRLVWSNVESQLRMNKSKILAIGVGRKWLATSSFDGSLRIHNSGDGSVVTTLPVGNT